MQETTFGDWTSEQQERMHDVLEVYVKWLNVHQHANGVTDSDYSLDSFLKGDGDCQLMFDSGNEFFDTSRVISFTATDGDEGGPASLMAFFATDYDGNNPTPVCIVQGFDTSVRTIAEFRMDGDGNEELTLINVPN